jgi:ribonuclease HI
LQHGFYLGTKTNNQAEYLALLLAVFELKKDVKSTDKVHIISDSQLMIRQMKGEYRVKNEDLKLLYAIGKKWLAGWHVTLSHVLREENVQADEMANVGVDKKRKPPQAFIENLKSENHSI